MIVPFGKYSGSDIKDIPVTYLEWFVENIEPKSDKLARIIIEMADEIRERRTNMARGSDGLRGDNAAILD